MQETYKFEDALSRVQECLKELGFDAKTEVSEHEGVVYARKEIEGKCIRVVTHITDREIFPANAGSPELDIRKTRAGQIAIRPSLATQAASRYVPPEEGNKLPCD